jgi:hypothetical protein
MSLVLLQSGANQTAHLANVYLTALRGNAVYSWHLQSQVILDRLKETRYFPGGRPTDFMLCRDSTLLMWLNIDLT